LSVSLYFVAIRQFVGRPYSKPWLAMWWSVVVVGAVAGQKYQVATIFNGFVYGALELLNALTLWRATQSESKPVQRTVALAYFLMGIVLPLRPCLNSFSSEYRLPECRTSMASGDFHLQFCVHRGDQIRLHYRCAKLRLKR
jgi:hypothetical protein